jgi:hypothetical protein
MAEKQENFNSTFNFDSSVVKGWKEKSALRELQLASFIPFVKIFAVLEAEEDVNLAKSYATKIYSGITIQSAEEKKISCTLVEIAQTISQTQTSSSLPSDSNINFTNSDYQKRNFRGGIGVTELTVDYNIVDAGAFQIRTNLVISNIEQFSLNKINSRLLFPSNKFLIVYGWNSGNNNSFSIESNSTINLSDFEQGMRRKLFCTLHSYNWEFGEQGRIYGTLTFFAVDDLYTSLMRIDKLYNDFIFFLQDKNNLVTIKNNFETDNGNNTITPGKQNTSIYKEIHEKPKEKNPEFTKNITEAYDWTGITIYKSIGNNEKNDLSKMQEYVYAGWVFETARYILNKDMTDASKKTYIIYDNIKNYQYSSKYYTINQDNSVTAKNITNPASNVFFIPLTIQQVDNFFINFRGNFKDFLSKFCEFINSNYEALNIVANKTTNNVYEIKELIGGLNEKSVSLSKDGSTYVPDDVTMHIKYGTVDSLLNNVKISAKIPPDILWGYGVINGNIADDKVTMALMDKILLKSSDPNEADNNPLWFKIIDEFVTVLKKEGKPVPAGNAEVKKLLQQKQYQKITTKALNNLLKNPTFKIENITNGKTISSQITIGTILRNYFNGLTLTIHGTSGWSAFKPFLFQGMELNLLEKGIDGLYTVVQMTDFVDLKHYATIIEAAKVNSLPIRDN